MAWQRRLWCDEEQSKVQRVPDIASSQIINATYLAICSGHDVERRLDVIEFIAKARAPGADPVTLFRDFVAGKTVKTPRQK
jgi:hypothetical protein